MTNRFVLDSQLAKDCFIVTDLTLCQVLLMNNSLYPWLILVPKRHSLREIMDLTESEQLILMQEITAISKIMKKLFTPYKLNIAALGNIVEQLHIHIIARFKDDECFPQPVFGKKSKPYDALEKNELIDLLQGNIIAKQQYI